MTTQDFYDIIDRQLIELLEKYKEREAIKKHAKNSSNQKSYALLIWFLEFYGLNKSYTSYITDGKDDHSCDIIFDSKDKSGETIFYVVQAKWNNKRNATKETSRDEILKALSDFETILRGDKKTINEKLNVQLESLEKHLRNNGEVKFIFLSLAQYKGGADENIQTFINNDDKITFEVIDIDRIRTDYIDRTYKEIKPLNPLEKYANPEEEYPIELEILQENGNFIKVEKPFDAYVVLVRPSSIYKLFDKYGFALFHKNVRNPLLQSKFNEQIERTAIENPAYFWYYNNGITAITYLLPKIGKQATKLKLTGLQIINGAQTVYALYKAYKEASPAKQQQMDSETFVTLRLLKSGGKEFDLNVTRYTNSQNPVQNRDFYANDDVQIRLQNASYNTKIWYEKRKDEFRTVPEGITVVPNYVFANAYLAYHLQDPTAIGKNIMKHPTKDMNFVSHKEHKEGRYEDIFTVDISYEDMLCSFILLNLLKEELNFSVNFKNILDPNSYSVYPILAVAKSVLDKYLRLKYKTSKVNQNKYVTECYEKGDFEVLMQIFMYSLTFTVKKVFNEKKYDSKEEGELIFVSGETGFDKVLEKLENTEITVEEIEGIKIYEDSSE